MTHPNFFLIGHPRSGTGTLDGYLLSHPNVFMGAKELHYFGSDLHFNNPPRSLKNYLEYFKKATQKKIGESSTWYLTSTKAAAEIKAFAPKAKIILSLRNPVDWLYSLHSHMVFAGYEDTLNFEEALSKNEQRIKGSQIPKNAYPPIGVCYSSLVQYKKQIERYFKSFGKENVQIILFDQLKKHPEKVFDQILSFLELPQQYKGKVETLESSKKQRNANHIHRNKALHLWIKSGSRRSILQGVTKTPVPGPRFVLRLLHKLNTKTIQRKKLDPFLYKKLTEQFKDEVEQLEELIQADLCLWKGNDATIL